MSELYGFLNILFDALLDHQPVLLSIFKNELIPFFPGLPHNKTKKELPYPIQHRALINITAPRS